MEKVRAVLTAEEIIERSDPRYETESQVWSHHKNLHPQFVARPKDAESLSRLLRVLNETDVEFNVRGGGCGSASSRGVLISTAAFDDFEFIEESDGNEAYAIVGAGLLWGEVDRRMEERAPGYAVSTSTHIPSPNTNSPPPTQTNTTHPKARRRPLFLPRRQRHHPSRRPRLALLRVRPHLRPLQPARRLRRPHGRHLHLGVFLTRSTLGAARRRRRLRRRHQVQVPGAQVRA